LNAFHIFSPHLRKLQTYLSPQRYHHSLSCAKWAAELAVFTGFSPERAYVAGLLHDCARDLPEQKARRLLNAYQGKHCPRATRENPKLWHMPLGIVIAKKDFGIQDSMILRAIGIHSVGAAHMTLLDTLLYIADYSEPGRKHASAKRIRVLAKNNLHAALITVTKDKCSYLKKKGLSLHPNSLALVKTLKIKI
jgi:predicted HD superfamily hydrolase involved in NAD metabolism